MSNSRVRFYIGVPGAVQAPMWHGYWTRRLSGREKTVVDCIDRPDLAGGEGEAATILATTCHRIDWHKATSYLERMSSKTLTRRFGWR